MMPQIAATKNYAGYERRQRGGVIEGVESKEAEGEGAETETIKCQVFHEQQRMLCLYRGRAGPEAVGQIDKARGDECFMLFYICWQLTEWSVGRGKA